MRTNMLWSRPFGSYFAAVGALLFLLGVYPDLGLAAQISCPVNDRKFELIKGSDEYLLLYYNTVVAFIGRAELNDLYGGKPADVSCDDVFSSPDVIGFVAGWDHDLLIAYGITRDISGQAVSLNKLGWAPHGNQLHIQMLGPKDFFDPTSHVHICWNQLGNGRWMFGNSSHSPCTGDPPGYSARETIFTVKL